MVTNTLGNSQSNPQTNQSGGTLKRFGKLKSSTTKKMKNKNNEKDDKDDDIDPIDGGIFICLFIDLLPLCCYFQSFQDLQNKNLQPKTLPLSNLFDRQQINKKISIYLSIFIMPKLFHSLPI